MGTRGAIGFVLNGDEKVTYNHFDSYPSGVGSDVLKFAQGVEDWDAVRDRVARLTLIDDQATPTPEQAAQFAEYTDKSVRDGEDWYSVLREAQGDLAAYLSIGFLPDSTGFPQNSLFCEYAYIIDLDASRFEVYVGFQKVEHTDGRFAGREGYSSYFPVRLAASWPLDGLPSDDGFSSLIEGVERFYREQGGADYFTEDDAPSFPGPVIF